MTAHTRSVALLNLNVIQYSTRVAYARVTGRVLDPIEYIVCKRNRVIYISNPKVACSSIKHSLLRGSRISQDDNVVDRRIHEIVVRHNLSRRKPPITNDWFYFTFVRDPFSRLVSFYKNKIASGDRVWAGYSYFSKSFRPYMPFSDVVHAIQKIPDRMAERHFKSQAYLILTEARRCNFIGKLENLETDLNRLSPHVNLTPLLVSNSSGSTKMDVAHYYDRETFEITRRRYAADIREFNYTRIMNEIGTHVYTTGEY